MNSQVIPNLREGEEFVCDNGCGSTQPELFDFEYSREEFPDGRVVRKTAKAFRSKCCKEEVSVYNNIDDTFVPIEEYCRRRNSRGNHE